MPKNPFELLFGGGGKGGSSAYTSPYTPQYESGLGESIANRAGGSFTKDKSGKMTYDFSQAGKPLQGAAGIKQATSGYDFSPQDKAIQGYGTPSRFTQTYNPYKFNFTGLPEQYGTLAYNQGSKDILRQGQGALQQVQRNVGTRRPGMLLRASEDSTRGTNENLGSLRAQIALQEMMSNVDMNKAQQESQAGEEYKGYQSRSDLERANSDNRLKYLNALEAGGRGKIATQSGLVESERAYQDKAIEMLQNMFNTVVGGQNAGAQAQNAAQANSNNSKKNALGFISDIASAI